MQISHRFFRFLLAGACATAVQYVLLILFVELFALPVVLAATISYTLSALVNYTINYRFTYHSTQSHHQTLPRFMLVAGCGLALNALLVTILHHWLAWHYLWAQIVSTVLVLLWNFLANTFWSFQSTART